MKVEEMLLEKKITLCLKGMKYKGLNFLCAKGRDTLHLNYNYINFPQQDLLKWRSSLYLG